jgi:glycerol-3-phosphate dehydrogenase
VPFNPANVVATAVGNATFTFADGNNASFAYTVNGIAQMKAITREIFAAPGTVCK